MKRYFICILILMFCSLAYAGPRISGGGAARFLQMKISAENRADAAIQTVPGYFYGLLVHTSGSGVVILNVYDDDNTLGNKILANWVVTSSVTDRTQSISYNPPIAYAGGLYVDIDLSTGGQLGSDGIQRVSYDAYYKER